MLSDKIAHYEETGELLRTTQAQYKAEFPWLCEVDSLSLANAQLHLETAYKNFFRDKNSGFPKYKSKHRGHNSYTTNLVNGNIVLAEGYLKLLKLGKVKVKQHRQIPEGYHLKSVTVSLTPSGKYYASILYSYEADIRIIEPVKVIGLDFSMTELYVSSERIAPEYPRPYRKALAKLKKEQRKHFVKIDRWYPSSKTCSRCGNIKEELLLSERIYTCGCGLVMNRDVNSAINIKNEGIRLLA